MNLFKIKKMAETNFYFMLKKIKKSKKNSLFNKLCQILKLNTFLSLSFLFLTFSQNIKYLFLFNRYNAKIQFRMHIIDIFFFLKNIDFISIFNTCIDEFC